MPSHDPNCEGSQTARCDCDCCQGARHGVRTGSFSAKAKKQLRTQINDRVIDKTLEEKLKIRTELLKGASEVLTTKLTTSSAGRPLTSSAGCIMDELAEAATEALEATGAPKATSRKTALPLDECHILCSFFTIVYNSREAIKQAAQAGASGLVDVVAEHLADELNLKGQATEDFVRTLQAVAASSLADKLRDLIFMHVGLPTPEELVVLIVAFCPDLEKHPEAKRVVDCKIDQAIVKAAAAIGLQCTLGPKPSPALMASHNAGVAPPARGITAARS